MKKLIIPNSFKQIKDLIELYDGVIVGIDKLCMNMPTSFSFDKIVEIVNFIKENNKEVFIALNKNMFNKDLESLKEILIKLDELSITGILYYDIAIVNLKKKLNLKTPLVWNQEHLTTNYLTSNFWYEYGSDYVYLSNEITLDEINEIKKNTKCKTMTTLFGYLPMFVSRRHLVRNYLDTFNIKDNSKINYLYKENKYYKIIDTEDGTIAYSSHILNGIEEMLKIDTDYVVLNSFGIEDDTFYEVLEMFNNVNKSNVLEYNERINSLLETYKGFLYSETIYKVK